MNREDLTVELLKELLPYKFIRKNLFGSIVGGNLKLFDCITYQEPDKQTKVVFSGINIVFKVLFPILIFINQ